MTHKIPNIVALLGGLGNQLFQYSFGLSLEHIAGRPTRFDLRPLSRYRLHGGQLAIENIFDISLARAHATDFCGVARVFDRPHIISALFRLSKFLGPIVPLKSDYNFRGAEHRACYYFGYWQTPTYGMAALNQLSFRQDILEMSRQALVRADVDPDSDVVVHIRRGDFLHAGRNPHLPLYEQTYFLPLMQSLHTSSQRKFLVISDDVQSLRTGPMEDFKCTFAGPELSPTMGSDLCLLSLVRTKILSASSFSWWGAALSAHDDPCVLAPNPWVKLAYQDDPVLAAHPMPHWHLIDTVGVQQGTDIARLPVSMMPPADTQETLSDCFRHIGNHDNNERASQ